MKNIILKYEEILDILEKDNKKLELFIKNSDETLLF